jgi:spermidine synthase
VNSYLEIFLSRNQFQLATVDALYSDGDRYRPATIALHHLRQVLPAVKSVLVLGTGLGSMVRAMRKEGYDPRFTLVDNDKVVLEWAMEFLDGDMSRITPVCGDAQKFIAKNTAKFDIVFIDIFSGRVVPDFVTTGEFLQQCRDSLAPGGHLVFNYIVNDPLQWENVQIICAIALPGYQVIGLDINRIIIA